MSSAIKGASQGARGNACSFGLLSIKVELVSSDSCFGNAADHPTLTSHLLTFGSCELETRTAAISGLFFQAVDKHPAGLHAAPLGVCAQALVDSYTRPPWLAAAVAVIDPMSEMLKVTK